VDLNHGRGSVERAVCHRRRHSLSMRVHLWIPALSCPVDILAGSAIVSLADLPEAPLGGLEQEPNRIVCYFEGDLYGASNLVTFADRADIASGRMIEQYPTTAVAALVVTEIVLVGSYDTDSGQAVIDPARRQDLCEWIGVSEDALDAELQTTSVRHVARRQLLTLDPMQARFLRTHGPSIYRDSES